MDRFAFWQRWLFTVSIGITAFGVFMAFFNRTEVFNIFNHQIDPVFWDDASVPETASQFQGWLYGVWGATVAGWGLMVAFLTHYPFRTRKIWAWNAIVFSLGVWYLLDTGISLFFGVIFNAGFNTLLALLLVPPLGFTRKLLTK
jgi:hypothetical protein